MEILSSREWAIAIWSVVAFIYLVTKEEIKKYFLEIAKIFFCTKLVVAWGIYIVYVSSISFLLSLLPIWDTVFIKDILVWTIFSGLIYYMNAASRNADEVYIKRIIKEIFKLIIILEFIMNTFTLHIFVELLIIPVVTVLGLLSFLSERDPQYQNLQKIFDGTIIIIASIVLYKTIELGMREYTNLNLLNTCISFMIPIAYFIFRLPIVYMIELYSKYEALFTIMVYKDKRDGTDNRKRRFSILKVCNFSVRKLLRFQREYLPKMYSEISDTEFEAFLKAFKSK